MLKDAVCNCMVLHSSEHPISNFLDVFLAINYTPLQITPFINCKSLELGPQIFDSTNCLLTTQMPCCKYNTTCCNSKTWLL